MSGRGNWQPMETAPKDDTEILIWSLGGGMYVAQYAYTGNDGVPRWQPVGLPSMRILYWMPLPKPPEKPA